MATQTIHRQETDFDERNLFLHLVLGVVSAGSRLERLARRPAGRAPEADVPTRHDELFLHFLLGLISLRRRAGKAIDAAGGGEAAAADETAEPIVGLRELLR